MKKKSAKRILVVDDESTILMLLEHLLAAEGYEVVTAADGNEALDLAQDSWFDLFLVDLIMPHKEGIETILSLRTSFKDARIIAMSGGLLNGTSCLPLAAKLGARATLAKPFDSKTLLETIRAVLEMEEMVDEVVSGSPDPAPEGNQGLLCWG